MVTYILCFCVSCSANVPTVHVYEAVIVGLLYAHRNCCSIMLEVFFSSTTNYALWWVQQFIYVWGSQDWGKMYSSPYLLIFTIMVVRIVYCVPNQSFSQQIRYTYWWKSNKLTGPWSFTVFFSSESVLCPQHLLNSCN